MLDDVYRDAEARMSKALEATRSDFASIRTGRAWKVPAGHVFRIVTLEGPQVGDLSQSCINAR